MKYGMKMSSITIFGDESSVYQTKIDHISSNTKAISFHSKKETMVYQQIIFQQIG